MKSRLLLALLSASIILTPASSCTIPIKPVLKIAGGAAALVVASAAGIIAYGSYKQSKESSPLFNISSSPGIVLGGITTAIPCIILGIMSIRSGLHDFGINPHIVWS
jgi:hypothetical protein